MRNVFSVGIGESCGRVILVNSRTIASFVEVFSHLTLSWLYVNLF